MITRRAFFTGLIGTAIPQAKTPSNTIKCPLGHDTQPGPDSPLVMADDDGNVGFVPDVHLMCCDVCSVLFAVEAKQGATT